MCNRRGGAEDLSRISLTGKKVGGEKVGVSRLGKMRQYQKWCGECWLWRDISRKGGGGGGGGGGRKRKIDEERGACRRPSNRYRGWKTPYNTCPKNQQGKSSYGERGWHATYKK